MATRILTLIMKEMRLSDWKIAMVDDEDFLRIQDRGYAWMWSPKKKGSKLGCVTSNNKNLPGPSHLKLHRFVMNAKPGQMIDHIDGNTLNNQKTNLRFCSHSQNNANKRLSQESKSGFKGVSWCSCTNLWRARIKQNGSSFTLGRFKNKIEAAICYDSEAIKRFGEYALTNKRLGVFE